MNYKVRKVKALNQSIFERKIVADPDEITLIVGQCQVKSEPTRLRELLYNRQK